MLMYDTKLLHVAQAVHTCAMAVNYGRCLSSKKSTQWQLAGNTMLFSQWLTWQMPLSTGCYLIYSGQRMHHNRAFGQDLHDVCVDNIFASRLFIVLWPVLKPFLLNARLVQHVHISCNLLQALSFLPVYPSASHICFGKLAKHDPTAAVRLQQVSETYMTETFASRELNHNTICQCSMQRLTCQ